LALRLGRWRVGSAVPKRAATRAIRVRKITSAGRAERREVKAPGAYVEAAHVPPAHLRLISLAAVIGAALPVAIWAKSRKSHLLSGAPLAGLLPVVM
jgi:hypothetical protein